MFSTLDNPIRVEAPNTIRATLEWAEDELEREGIEEPRLDAEYLLAHCLGIERWQLYCLGNRVLTDREEAIWRRLLQERRNRRPLAYIIGWTGFYNLDLRTDPRALIPRPETELLVERAIALLEGSSAGPAEVVDLGCGGGTIALALAREYPAAVIGASDLSPAALELARENAESSGLADRVTFRQGDLLAPWADRREDGFDLILSNPPYLSDREWARTPPEVRMYEPAGALQGGLDGLDVIRRIVQKSPDYLKPGGHLIFEIGAGQGEAVRELLEVNKGLTFFGITRDYGGMDRVVEAYK